MTALQWVAVDLLTGSVVCDLPGISAVQDPFRRTLGKYEIQGATLTVTGKTDPSWYQGTKPGYSALIGYRGDPGSEVVEWGGIVTRRQRWPQTNAVVLSLVTPEAYLDRRYAGDYAKTNWDQNLICTDLIAQFAADTGGMPFTTSVVGTAGAGQTVSIHDTDDTTVYARLQQAMGMDGGPEFSGHWIWTHNPERIHPVIYVGSRIGTAVLPGMQPAAWFDTSMLTADASFDEDYGASKGANVVTATASGQGTGRDQTTALLIDNGGRPKFEYRWNPNTSSSGVADLQSYAGSALGVMQDGANTVTLAANIAAAPRLGVDWNLGDDIGYEFTGITFPVPVTGVGRAIGYEVDDTTVRPILPVPKGF